MSRDTRPRADRRQRLHSTRTIGGMAVGLIVLAGFVLYELRDARARQRATAPGTASGSPSPVTSRAA